MKGSRLVDVLDELGTDPKYREFWEKMFNKMAVLANSIEKSKGSSMSIDDQEYRWVTDRLEYWNSEERLLTKQEMQIANLYWKRYGKV